MLARGGKRYYNNVLHCIVTTARRASFVLFGTILTVDRLKARGFGSSAEGADGGDALPILHEWYYLIFVCFLAFCSLQTHFRCPTGFVFND
jgi:hypothetical protein